MSLNALFFESAVSSFN